MAFSFNDISFIFMCVLVSGEWKTGTITTATWNNTIVAKYDDPPEGEELGIGCRRFDNNLIKSTQEFITWRRELKKGSEVEVYSETETQRRWHEGRIEEVIFAGEHHLDKAVDVFRIFYSDKFEDKDYSKYVERWSTEIRKSQLSPEMKKWKRGTKVTVWSNVEQVWMAGVVEELVPKYEVVNVRYGDDKEKMVPISSDEVKIYDGD